MTTSTASHLTKVVHMLDDLLLEIESSSPQQQKQQRISKQPKQPKQQTLPYWCEKLSNNGGSENNLQKQILFSINDDNDQNIFIKSTMNECHTSTTNDDRIETNHNINNNMIHNDRNLEKNNNNKKILIHKNNIKNEKKNMKKTMKEVEKNLLSTKACHSKIVNKKNSSSQQQLPLQIMKVNKMMQQNNIKEQQQHQDDSSSSSTSNLSSTIISTTNAKLSPIINDNEIVKEDDDVIGHYVDHNYDNQIIISEFEEVLKTTTITIPKERRLSVSYSFFVW